MLNSQITKISVYKFSLLNKEPFRIAIGVQTQAGNLLVRIHTADGLYGVGEGAPISYIAGETQETCYAVATDIARLFLGRNAAEIDHLHRLMDAHLPRNNAVKCAFDIALYDLMGKRLGIPLYTLLGGEKRPVETDWTVAIDTPEKMAQKAAAIQQQGFRAIKLKLGTKCEDDLARVRAVRQAVGPAIPIRIDANQGWSMVEAIDILTNLAAYKIQYCEQPVAYWNESALRRIREHCSIPIVADESLFDHHDAFRLVSGQACDYLNIKLSKAAGIYPALKINAIAEAAGMRCMLGSMAESRLGLTAAAHLASARPNIAFTDLDTAFFHVEDPVTGGIRYESGLILLPDAPGLGADIPEGALQGAEQFNLSA